MTAAPRTFEVSFTSGHPPVIIPEHGELSRHLTATNSPVLFGCRTGICGTCAATVEVIRGELPPADEEELETLEAACPENAAARLLCQLKLTADIRITVG